MLDQNDNIKLSDFGVGDTFTACKYANKNDTDKSSSVFDDSLKGNAGSDCYFCPESCSTVKYSGKNADLWACGVTLYQLVFAKLPFTGKDRMKLYENIKHSSPEYVKDQVKITECTDFELLVDLLTKMFKKNPAERINI